MAELVRIELEGFKELARNMGDPRLVREPIREMLEEAASIGQDTAIKAISGGTGLAERSIGHRVYSRGMRARVYTMIARPRAMSIEHGRSPGQLPSFLEIARWLKGSTSRIPQLTREEREQVIEIQEAIRQHGARGKGYMSATREALDEELPRLKETMMQRLKELFHR